MSICTHITLFTFSLHRLLALSCSGDFMSAHISRHYLQLKGYNAWEVYLNSSDSRCRPQITREYVVFNIPYSGCGTKRQESNNDTIVYSNNIKTSPFDEENIITRKTDMIFHIKCEMNENIMVETMFVVKNSVDITEKHHGHYEMTLGCYESASFSHKVYGFPYYVSMDQELFFEVILNNSDPNLILFLDTCKASPYAHDFENLTYPLIEHGCVRDSTYKNLPSPNKNTARFSFNSFKFVDQHNEIFLQCKLVVCMANDYSSRCYQGCLSRKKRNVDEDQSKVDVVVGPFKLQEKFQEDKRQELVKNVNPGKDEAFSPLTVATVVLAAMVFVLSGFLLNSRLRRRKYQQIY
nr:PREDICTED: deleted in malignant brain tumors 1 protein [Anolis carolinensis]|eukprot:XP_008122781.2 PREDICTED: deleted in malignant brain tumors 1 protein [Anolis carolinensis]